MNRRWFLLASVGCAVAAMLPWGKKADVMTINFDGARHGDYIRFSGSYEHDGLYQVTAVQGKAVEVEYVSD